VVSFRSTGVAAHHRCMAFEVVLLDESVEWVDGADSFQQEGPMTTFFASDGRRGTLDCWSVKMASFRTDRIDRIVRRDAARPSALAS
jgi:hypothetical protein